MCVDLHLRSFLTCLGARQDLGQQRESPQAKARAGHRRAQAAHVQGRQVSGPYEGDWNKSEAGVFACYPRRGKLGLTVPGLALGPPSSGRAWVAQFLGQSGRDSPSTGVLRPIRPTYPPFL